MKLLLGDIEILVTRKAMRSMRLTVHPDGRVLMSVPFWATNEQIHDFVQQRSSWIRNTRDKLLERHKQLLEQSNHKYITGETIHVFGQTLRLRVVAGAPRKQIEVQGDELALYCRNVSTSEQRLAQLREWQREQLHQVLTIQVRDWQERLNEPNVTWSIRRMRSEWGSCMARKRQLLFNLELARFPLACVEYVVVHELTHLQVQNHGPQFKALMDQHLPNWRQLKKDLNNPIH